VPRASVPVRFGNREALDRASKAFRIKASLHSAPRTPMSSSTKPPRTAKLLVVLDGVEDPTILRAIIRTAHAPGPCRRGL